MSIEATLYSKEEENYYIVHAVIDGVEHTAAMCSRHINDVDFSYLTSSKRITESWDRLKANPARTGFTATPVTLEFNNKRGLIDNYKITYNIGYNASFIMQSEQAAKASNEELVSHRDEICELLLSDPNDKTTLSALTAIEKEMSFRFEKMVLVLGITTKF